MIGKRIQTARRLRRIKQETLAHECGLTSGAISSYEREISEPTLSAAKIIAETLGVSMDYMVGNTNCLNDTRCRDCRYSHPIYGGLRCEKMGIAVKPRFFCAYAEGEDEDEYL